MVTAHASVVRTRTGESGFSLVEMLVASAVSIVVLGGAVMLTTQIQNGYRRQVEDSTAIQEARYALDWVGRLIRGAGNNSFARVLTDCPVAATPIQAVTIDPNGDGVNDDIRLQSDSNPPDGVFGGTAGNCNQPDEDVTISFDPANNVIVFFDNNLGGDAVVRTDRVIDSLEFIYRDAERNITAQDAFVAFVEVRIGVRTRTIDPLTNAPVTQMLTQEFRIRGR
jgi:type II secretory pathway pseudopilin PulG